MSSLSLKSADYILKYLDAKYELLFEIRVKFHFVAFLKCSIELYAIMVEGV
jgi:hypothetical protein